MYVHNHNNRNHHHQIIDTLKTESCRDIFVYDSLISFYVVLLSDARGQNSSRNTFGFVSEVKKPDLHFIFFSFIYILLKN